MAIASRTDGSLKLSMLGKNTRTKEVDLYQISIFTGEPITLSIDPLSSGNYDMIDINGRDGSIVGRVRGDEQAPSGEVSFSFLEDFSYLGKNFVYGNSKNRLLNFLAGEAFNNKGDIIVPIGTNGTDKTKTAQAKPREMNKRYKYLFYNEGAFIKEVGTADESNGWKTAKKKNPYADAFNRTYKTFMAEIMTVGGSENGGVNRVLPILGKKTMEWVEGEKNQFNCTAERGCDVFERNDFFAEIYPEKQDLENTNELYVTYFATHNHADAMPDGEVEGDLMLSIDVTGQPTIYEWDGTTWEVNDDLQAMIKMGTRFKTTKVYDGEAEPIEKNAFAVMYNEDGDAGSLCNSDNENVEVECVCFSYDPAVKRYYCLVKDFDINCSSNFDDYLTV